ncbi:uncharacterized protein ARMOST_04238 [Armillaria ostoyae]|uniref:Secreted protein n=2 Tax=Armillaria TaxID=47424 RepID=A0A284QWT4_ARMOS|nr:hypothetical protein ARMSODRAFT_1078185 [Armillaria solidipes]SJL00924.1 uncharacterized protein ARMOST_04238 [Armillaria ostoyae]
MRLSSARSFCVIWTLYFLLAECRPFKLGGAIGALEGAMTGAGIESSAQECPSNPPTLGQVLVRRGKQTVTNQGSGEAGGGSVGGSGSSGGGQTDTIRGSAKPGGRTKSKHVHKERPETEDEGLS